MSQTHFEKILPRVKKCTQNCEKGDTVNSFLLVSRQKEKDIKDLHLLLENTFVAQPRSKMMRQQIVKICKSENLNLKLDGVKDIYDSSKPCITELLDTKFAQAVLKKAGVKNAFCDFKKDSRTTLELNEQFYLSVKQKKLLEQEKVKLICQYT